LSTWRYRATGGSLEEHGVPIEFKAYRAIGEDGWGAFLFERHRATIGYDYGYDGQLFYLDLALDEK
jgi:hypothetical protein